MQDTTEKMVDKDDLIILVCTEFSITVVKVEYVLDKDNHRHHKTNGSSSISTPCAHPITAHVAANCRQIISRHYNTRCDAHYQVTNLEKESVMPALDSGAEAFISSRFTSRSFT